MPPPRLNTCLRALENRGRRALPADLAGPAPDPGEVVSAVADGTLVTIREAGHYPNLENPDEWNRHLRNFLTRTAPR